MPADNYADHVARWTAEPPMVMALPEVPDNPGHVWVVYQWDNGHRALSIHLTAEEAAREAAKTGYAHAAKWPLGMDLDDAIREWVS